MGSKLINRYVSKERMLIWLASRKKSDGNKEVAKSEDRVKIIHTGDIKAWTRLPEYRNHDGLTLGEYRVQRQSVEDVLWKFRTLIHMQERLAELDADTPVEYAWHEISLPTSIKSRVREIELPKPDYTDSIVTCDEGEVSGGILRILVSRRKRKVTVHYACPSRVMNAEEITKLKDKLSAAGDKDLAQLAEAQASRYLQPVIFVSHRWDAIEHPDPDGQQLAKLQKLEDCFLIYDYLSFPQNTGAREDEVALLEILSDMNTLISNVLVLTAPDFLERGWCIYEYTVASMRASIVCDELNDPNFVTLRNLAATRPPVSLRISGHSIESGLQNAKNQRTLETVNTILPLFNRSKFTVERDREIVRSLLVSELTNVLPSKMEYIPYVGEWKMIPWTEDELREAFSSQLKWEQMQFNQSFKPFELKVPSTVTAAVKNSYRLDRMPVQNELTWTELIDWSGHTEFGKVFLDGIVKLVLYGIPILAGVIMLILVLLALAVWWIFF